jgi:hypothetical protein
MGLTAAGAQDQADQDARDHALSLGASTRRAKSLISTRAFADVQSTRDSTHRWMKEGAQVIYNIATNQAAICCLFRVILDANPFSTALARCAPR